MNSTCKSGRKYGTQIISGPDSLRSPQTDSLRSPPQETHLEHLPTFRVRHGDMGTRGLGDMGGIRGHGDAGTWAIHKTNTFRVRHGDWTHGDMAGTWGLGNGCWVWGLCGVGWLTDINRPANLGAFRVRDMAAWLT